jgi:NADH-quinone oxidoreductase subunit L
VQPGILVVLVLAAFLTAFYIGRQIILVFLGKPRSQPAAHATENPPVMTIPLVVLAILATLGGALNLPELHTLESWLEHTITALTASEFLLPLALTALVVALLGLGLAWMTYGRRPLREGQTDPLRGTLGPVFTWMNRKLYVDEFYQAIAIRPYDWLADKLAHPIDLGVIDAVSNGLAAGTQALSAGLRKFQNGFVRYYALAMLAGAVVVLGYLIFNFR